MDLILTGRGVQGEEAFRMGLANRLVPKGQALDAALRLAHELPEFPQRCLRSLQGCAAPTRGGDGLRLACQRQSP